MAWDKTKPANNAALVSSEIRANWTAIEAAFGASLDTAIAFNFLPTGLGAWKFSRSTADLTKNASTAFSDVTGVSFTVGASETWAWLCLVHGISSVAAQFKFTFTGPAAPTAVRFGLVSQTGVAAATSQAAFGSAVNCAGTTVDIGLHLFGLLRNGANAGTVQMQFAQQNSDATNSKVYAESSVIAVRFA